MTNMIYSNAPNHQDQDFRENIRQSNNYYSNQEINQDTYEQEELSLADMNQNENAEFHLKGLNNQYHAYNYWNNHFDVIKEEVQNENNPSSFDNLSNSFRFDNSTQGFHALKAQTSLSALSLPQNSINLNYDK